MRERSGRPAWPRGAPVSPHASAAIIRQLRPRRRSGRRARRPLGAGRALRAGGRGETRPLARPAAAARRAARIASLRLRAVRARPARSDVRTPGLAPPPGLAPRAAPRRAPLRAHLRTPHKTAAAAPAAWPSRPPLQKPYRSSALRRRLGCLTLRRGMRVAGDCLTPQCRRRARRAAPTAVQARLADGAPFGNAVVRAGGRFTRREMRAGILRTFQAITATERTVTA